MYIGPVGGLSFIRKKRLIKRGIRRAIALLSLLTTAINIPVIKTKAIKEAKRETLGCFIYSFHSSKRSTNSPLSSPYSLQEKRKFLFKAMFFKPPYSLFRKNASGLKSLFILELLITSLCLKTVYRLGSNQNEFVAKTIPKITKLRLSFAFLFFAKRLLKIRKAESAVRYA